MRSILERGVQRSEHPGARPEGMMPDWENLRVFLEVARRGSFRSAAIGLGTTVNSVRYRIDKLEHQIGAPLFTRHVDGVRPTAEGDRVLSCATEMESASFGLLRERGRAAQPLEGDVRIAVTEGLGTFWVVPRLVEFQRAHPRLVVDLHCTMRPADVLRAEADIAIQIKKPTAPDLKLVKLGRMHIMLCAAQSYIDTYGCPTNEQQIAEHHRVVMMYADQGDGKAYYDHLFPGKPQPGFMAMRTSASSALYWAIANGAGIGWLPTYLISIGAQVVPLDIDWIFPFDIWLAYHPDTSRMPRVRRMIDWVVDAFNPRMFPWFGDEFIHPKDLEKHYRGPPLTNMFNGFLRPEYNATISRRGG